MADQDQPVNPNEPFKFSTTVTGQMPPDQPAPTKGLPSNFGLLSHDQQEQYLEPLPGQKPGTLPDVTNEQIGQFALEAAPYVAATAAGIATGGIADYIGLPWYYALMARPVVSGLVGGAAEYGKQEAYKRNLFDTGQYAPESSGEEWQRIGEQTLNQLWPEALGSMISIPGEMKAARAAAGGPEYLPGRRAYSRAVGKVANTAAETTPILRSGIKYRIFPTEEGAEKAWKLAGNFNTQIDQEIARRPSWFSAREWTAEVEQRFDKLRQAAGATSTNSVENLKVVDDAERDFLINHGRVPIKRVPVYNQQGQIVRWRALDRMKEPLADLRARAKSISAADMQRLKKGTWAEVRRKANPRSGPTILGISDYTNPGFELDALEELGRAERALLGRRYQGIHEINEAEGHMYELERGIQRKLQNEGRRPIFNPEAVSRAWKGAAYGGAAGEYIGKGPAGAAIGGVAGAALPLTIEAARNPSVLAYRAFIRNRLAQPGFARATARAALPGAIRTGQYLTEQPPEAIQEIGPEELAEAGGPTTQEMAKYDAYGFPKEEPPPPPPRTAYEPRVEDVPAQDRPIYERERPMKERDQPLYNWRPEWAKMLASEEIQGKNPLTLSLLHTVAAMEASGRAAEQQKVAPNMVRSDKGAVGLMQVMPDMHGATAEELQDPQLNIMIGAQILRDLNNKYMGQPWLVLAAYNAGEGALRKAGYKFYNLHKETQDYVLNGLRMWAQLSGSPEQASEYIASIPDRLK